jgi:phage terminase large subunit
VNERFVVKIPRKLVPVFGGKARYRGAYGGRGSGKSYTFALMLALRGAQQPLRILCAREYQNSIRDSSQAEIARAIESVPFLAAHYDVGDSYIRGRNGTEFVFRGLRHNYQSIKSMAGIGICWVEEAETVSEESWRVLIPTIRAPGSEIWLTWNPEREDSPTRQRFIVNQPAGAKIAQVNWRDNPWFPTELEQERQDDLRYRPDQYDHVWEGACLTRSDALVLRGRHAVEAFEPQQGWDGPYYGIDWGFSVDPSVMVRCWIHGRVLYVEHEAYGHGVEIDNLPQLFAVIPGAREHVSYADSARPETISYMVRNGYRYMRPADKWPGSVEDGIEHLRSYERIVIHPRCEHAAREARLWSYKIDRLTGDVKPDLMPGNDHCWDAVRYALGPIIRRQTPTQAVTLPYMSR